MAYLIVPSQLYLSRKTGSHKNAEQRRKLILGQKQFGQKLIGLKMRRGNKSRNCDAIFVVKFILTVLKMLPTLEYTIK